MGKEDKAKKGKEDKAKNKKAKIKRAWGYVAGSVALFAISLQCLAIYDVWLFFQHLPEPFGYFLWLFTQRIHQMGDFPWLSAECWKEVDWLKPRDLVVAGPGMESGANWVLYCSHQIRIKGSNVPEQISIKGSNEPELTFVDAGINTPWPELLHAPRQSWADVRAMMNNTLLEDGSQIKDRWDHSTYPFRIFKSQEKPQVIGIRSKLKFIAVVRTGVDFISSIGPFMCQYQKSWLQEFGMALMFNGACSSGQDASKLLQNKWFQDWYFDYVKAWWPYRNSSNVMLLHYNDMVKDHNKFMKKLVKFLEVNLTSDEFSKVSDQCTLSAVKKLKNLGDQHLPFHPDYQFSSKPMSAFQGGMFMHVFAHTSQAHFGKKVFSKEQQKEWAALEEKHLPDAAMRNWTRKGGPLPV